MENSPVERNKNNIKNISNFIKDNLIFKNSIFFILSIILFIIIFYNNFLTPPRGFNDQTIINIERGSTLRKISNELKNKKIIRSKVLFETFVVFYKGENRIEEGDYLFDKGLPVFEVAKRLSRKDRNLATIKITIPEGFDVHQIADTFSLKLKNFNKEIFLEEAENKNGYLFPDTYFFVITDDEKDVLQYMSRNFEKKIKSIEQEILSSGKNKNDLIIMASIIEREAKGDNDRGIISGILWNRISKGMPLQVDAALQTYKTKGLPEYPISNPGLKAIKASMYPIKSDYLYYIHDRNGLIHYSHTFTEHRQNVLKYLK